MYIKQLTVQGVRNLGSQTLEPAPQINLLAGPNGSGKTSLLEAIYLLGRGRSFRARAIKAVINAEEGVDQCTVFGLLADESEHDASQGGSVTLPVGVSRETKGGFHFKVGGEQVNTASALAETLPLVLVNTESFQLLAGGPQNRRAYLDRGLFHTCPAFKDLWRRQQRALRQRNTLLKRGKGRHLTELPWWDEQFSELSEQITRLRQQYLASIEPLVLEILGQLSSIPDISFSYRQGWDSNKTLREVLKAGAERDIMVGSSQHGPQRADLRVRCRQQNAAAVLSRGQTKSLVMAMMIAQGVHYRAENGKASVFLIDDLPAELDAEQQQKVAELIAETGCQTFITGTDEEQLLAPWRALGWASVSRTDRAPSAAGQSEIERENSKSGNEGRKKDSIKVFHVKHGEIVAA